MIAFAIAVCFVGGVSKIMNIENPSDVNVGKDTRKAIPPKWWFVPTNVCIYMFASIIRKMATQFTILFSHARWDLGSYGSPDFW